MRMIWRDCESLEPLHDHSLMYLVAADGRLAADFVRAPLTVMGLTPGKRRGLFATGITEATDNGQ